MIVIKNNHLIKEACVETKEQIDNAIKHKANQIELCARLDLGGYTPSDDLITYALEKQAKVLIMIRNRPDYGTTCWNTFRLQCIIKKYAQTSIHGFVFGFLKNGLIDVKTIKKFLKVTGDKETVFHMAFDELKDPYLAIDTLANLGITRILTKGGQNGPAVNNLAQLSKLKAYANNRIQLIVGGSVTDDNYQQIAKATGIKYYHGKKLAFNA
jgi:copper homeostasis protein